MNESMNKIPPISGLEYHEFAAYYAEEALRKIQYALDNMDGLRRKANTALEAVRSIQIKKEQYGESYLPEMRDANPNSDTESSRAQKHSSVSQKSLPCARRRAGHEQRRHRNNP